MDEFTLIVSEAILAEVEKVFLRKFRWDDALVAATLSRVVVVAEMVAPRIALSDCTDPDDNRILEAAVAGRADFVVSGDKHLLRMKAFRGIEILTVSDFLDRVAHSEGR